MAPRVAISSEIILATLLNYLQCGADLANSRIEHKNLWRKSTRFST